MASVRKLPSGTWQGRYTDSTGHTSYFTLSRVATKRDVLRTAHDLEGRDKQIRLGVLPPPDGQHAALLRPIAEVIAAYLAWGATQGSPGGRPWTPTHLHKRTKALHHWQTALSLHTLGDCERILPRVEQILVQEATAGLASQTRKHRVAAFKAFLTWCVKRDYLPRHPLAAMRPVHVVHLRQRRALTDAEIYRLLEACNPAHRLLYETALLTGLRAGELRQLGLDHLDLDAHGLRLDAAWTKNRQPGLQPLPDELIAGLYQNGRAGTALEQYRRARSRSPYPAQPLLWVPHNAVRILDDDLRKAGVPKQTQEGIMDFHALRTTFVSVLIAQGATYPEVQALARHKDVKTTLGVYGRARDVRLQALVNDLSRQVLPQRSGAPRVHAQAVNAPQPVQPLEEPETSAEPARRPARPHLTPIYPASTPHQAAPDPTIDDTPASNPHQTRSGPHTRCAPDVHGGLQRIMDQWSTLGPERQAAILRLLAPEEVHHD